MSGTDEFLLSRANFVLLHGLEQDGGSKCPSRGAWKAFFLPIAAQNGHLLAGTSGRCLGDFCKKTDVFPSMRARPTARRLLDEPP